MPAASEISSPPSAQHAAASSGCGGGKLRRRLLHPKLPRHRSPRPRRLKLLGVVHLPYADLPPPPIRRTKERAPQKCPTRGAPKTPTATRRPSYHNGGNDACPVRRRRRRHPQRLQRRPRRPARGPSAKSRPRAHVRPVHHDHPAPEARRPRKDVEEDNVVVPLQRNGRRRRKGAADDPKLAARRKRYEAKRAAARRAAKAAIAPTGAANGQNGPISPEAFWRHAERSSQRPHGNPSCASSAPPRPPPATRSRARDCHHTSDHSPSNGSSAYRPDRAGPRLFNAGF
jgi:hypothetical protein